MTEKERPRLSPREMFPIVWTNIESYEQSGKDSSCAFIYAPEKSECDVRRKYVEIINNDSCGFSRPQLLILINQLELFLDTIDYKVRSDSYKSDEKLNTMKLKVERELINEIIDGYEDTLKRLGFADKEIDSSNLKIKKIV